MKTLPSRDRRALTVGGTIIGAALLVAFGLRPLVGSLGEQRQRFAQEHGLLARELGIIAAHEKGELQRSGEHSVRFVRDRVFTARDETLLYARATAYLRALAELSRVELQDASVTGASTTEKGIRRLALDVRGGGEWDAILTFIHRLENSPVVIRVERIDIGPGPANREGAPRLTLALTIQIFGAEA